MAHEGTEPRLSVSEVATGEGAEAPEATAMEVAEPDDRLRPFGDVCDSESAEKRAEATDEGDGNTATGDAKSLSDVAPTSSVFVAVHGSHAMGNADGRAGLRGPSSPGSSTDPQSTSESVVPPGSESSLRASPPQADSIESPARPSQLFGADCSIPLDALCRSAAARLRVPLPLPLPLLRTLSLGPGTSAAVLCSTSDSDGSSKSSM